MVDLSKECSLLDDIESALNSGAQGDDDSHVEVSKKQIIAQLQKKTPFIEAPAVLIQELQNILDDIEGR